MTDQILQIPCELITDRTFRTKPNRELIFETQENIPHETLVKVLEMKGKTGWLAFLPSLDAIIEPSFVAGLPEIESDGGNKKPSQRLRACLWVLWEQEGKKGTFEAFYLDRMEKIITWVKEKLESTT